MKNNGELFLIPSFLGIGGKNDISTNQLKTIYSLNEFIIETEKPARAFLKAIEHPTPQSDFIFHLLNEHTSTDEDLGPYFMNCKIGKSIGLMSDAGIPCVADPGNRAVAFAHLNGINVRPLPGPSSIYLALMASGFNGQQFTFHGYIPIEGKERTKFIKNMEGKANSMGHTQIFMETPYRNEAMFSSLLKTLQENTKLCIATNISQENEFIKCLKISDWMKESIPLKKIPAVFLIGR